MKKYITILFFLSLIIPIFAQDLYINGSNDLRYIYKSAQDSLNSYFDDEFGFNLSYKKFSYGMKFIAEMPRYNSFVNNQYLTSGDLKYGWTERYVSYTTESLYALGGMFSETFGSGIVFSSVYDKDFNIDTRVNGAQLRILPENWMLKAVYGLVKNQSNNLNNGLIYGLDIQRYFTSFIFGGSALAYRKRHNLDNKFLKYNIFSFRAAYNSDLFETGFETAKIKEDAQLNEIAPIKDGFAIYATSNLYLKKFTISAGYKKYTDFDIYVNDPPRLNYSDEPLSENQNAGKDEEGIMAELDYSPNFDNNFIANYSEAWNKDKTIKLSDFFTKIDHTFKSGNSIAFELENIERYEEPISEWTKETTPVFSFDTEYKKIAVHLKTQYKIKRKVHFSEDTTQFEPFFQSDFSYKNKSLSLIFVYPYKSSGDFLKNKLWIGAEAKAELLPDTYFTFFAGKEKGGKVCRNGVCKYQSQFSGIRLNISTQF